MPVRIECLTANGAAPGASPGSLRRFRLHVCDGSQEIWFRSAEAPLDPGHDALVPAALLTAMKSAEPFEAPPGISPRLLGSLDRVQDMFTLWDDSLRRVEVRAAAESSTPARRPGDRDRLLLFRGVDSFHSVLKHLDEITHLVFVHGFDVRLDDAPLRAQVSRHLQAAAAALGKQLIEVETNLREFSDLRVHWNFFHGAALVAVAHLLSPVIGRLCVPASRSCSDLNPWGTHPLLDPLWSTERVEIVHDGCEATRIRKVAAIAESPVALEHLRVCYENRGGAYNCGRCEKCMRTMVSLRAVGALDRCGAFDAPLLLNRVARQVVDRANLRSFLEQNLAEVRRRGADPGLERALTDCLAQRYYRGLWKPLRFLWWMLRYRLLGRVRA